MKARVFLCLFTILTCLSCGYRQPSNIAPTAQQYIDEVIDILQHHSINKDAIHWQAFKNDVYRHANGSKTIEDTYPSITYAIEKLHDRHSYFAANVASDDTSASKPLPVLAEEVVPDNIGYIRLGFCMGNATQMQHYIDTVVHKIEKQDKATLKGWIVDLRGNFGGNMWAMLAAIGPILGEGTLGYTVYPDNAAFTWYYKDGKAYDENGIWGQSSKTYRLKTPNPYVAVLTDTSTASSGEAVTIAFKGRDKTKSFGAPTFGVSTSNRSHTLSDGSRINLTEAVFADRNKEKYGHSVYPDVRCDAQKTLQEAVNWLQNHD